MGHGFKVLLTIRESSGCFIVCHCLETPKLGHPLLKAPAALSCLRFMVCDHFSCLYSRFLDLGDLPTQLASGLEHLSPVGLSGEALEEPLIFPVSLALNGFSNAVFAKVTKEISCFQPYIIRQELHQWGDVEV